MCLGVLVAIRSPPAADPDWDINSKNSLLFIRDACMNTPSEQSLSQENRYNLLDYNRIKERCDLEKSWIIRKKR